MSAQNKNVKKFVKSAEENVEIVVKDSLGSAHAVNQEELERFESDDIHKILRRVPGVYIRQEDGYGLRPNIGMRGTGSERSAKITLLEDGILLAPAPYSAPAAYYFPLVTKMSRVETLKGPASIQYGPNTVGGALNLVTAPIPINPELAWDFARGSKDYAKFHGRIGTSWRFIGAQLEAIKLKTDGFKELDGGGNTGFDKNDVLLKIEAQKKLGGGFHTLRIKWGWADEVSNETYTGLTDEDFGKTPLRRYAATSLDRMSWNHHQLQASYRLDLLDLDTSIETTFYRHTLSRDWLKLNNFVGTASIDDVLSRPNGGTNAIFYGLLSGQIDSTSASERLLIGNNGRSFVSTGVQSKIQSRFSIGNWEHQWEWGGRVHADLVNRLHDEGGYRMVAGTPIRDDTSLRITTHNTGKALAMALYFQDSFRWSNMAFKIGVRTESINTQFENFQNNTENNDRSKTVVIPGIGMEYRIFGNTQVLAGLHKGFSPVGPNPDPNVNPEESYNLESGVRTSLLGVDAEAIGFFSHYTNLKGNCTFSSGCSNLQIGNEFNGGKVRVLGAEFLMSAEWKVADLRIPFKLTYTLSHASFLTSFTSSNPQWGDVSKDDRLPYLPLQQGNLDIGLGGKKWESVITGSLTGSMLDRAGKMNESGLPKTDTSVVMGVAAYYHMNEWAKVYFTVQNALNTSYVVSRRPFGARPGVPRLLTLGIKGQL